jgi:hypothetical protein
MIPEYVGLVIVASLTRMPWKMFVAEAQNGAEHLVAPGSVPSRAR